MDFERARALRTATVAGRFGGAVAVGTLLTAMLAAQTSAMLAPSGSPDPGRTATTPPSSNPTPTPGVVATPAAAVTARPTPVARVARVAEKTSSRMCAPSGTGVHASPRRRG